MPIDVSVMDESGTEVKTIRNAAVQDEVLSFLKKNKKSAYTQKEIGEELGIRPQQARQCCFALQKKGVVDRKAVPITKDNGKTVDEIHWCYTA